MIRLLFALALVACRPSSDGDPTKVTVESKDDATQPIVDEDFRFKLAWPGSGWKLMRQHDISKMSPDAIAGAVYGRSRFGVVIVEHIPGITLDGFTDLLIENQQLADKQVELREPTRFAGAEAMRLVTSGTIDGTAFRYHATVFLHQGYGYQVIAFGERADVSPSGSEVQAFFDAFSILPGAVAGRSTKSTVDETAGPGWRIEDGVFESVAGVRVRAQQPWRLYVGDPLRRTNADAEVGLAHSDPDIYAVLITERAPPAAHRRAYLEERRAGLAGRQGKPFAGTFAGKPIELARFTRDDAYVFEYLHGLRIEGDRSVQVLFWYPSADRERAEALVPSALASFRLMSERETAALAGELDRAPDTQGMIGPRHSLRDGVYRNFVRRWRWTKPHASWRAEAGDTAQQRTPSVDLWLFEPRRGLTVLVYSDSNPDAATYHADQVDRHGGDRTAKVSTVTYGDLRWQVSTVDLDEAGTTLRTRVATTVTGSLGLRVKIIGQPADLERYAADVATVLAGFRYDDRPMIENTGGEYRDHRFGFAATPPPGWTFSDQTPGQAGDRTFVVWQGGRDDMVGVVAFPMPVADDKWFLDFIEQMIRDSAAGHAIGSAARSEATLAGHRARRLHWPRLDVYVLLRHGFGYALITTRGDAGAFRLLGR